MSRFTLLFLLLPTLAIVAEELPYTSFAHLPMIEQPRVSPDGNHVAAILNGAEGPTIVVSPFGTSDLNAIVRLKYGDDRIEWIDWANNERILISVSEAAEFGGQHFRVSRLYQVGLDGKGMKQVRRKAGGANAGDTDNVLSMLPDEPDHILMQLWDERDNSPAVFKVEFAKNKFKKLFPNTYDVDAWWADDEGNVVFGIEFNVNTNEITTWYRPAGDKNWRPLHTREFYGDETFSPVFVSGDKVIVLSDHELRRQALWQYDLASGSYEQTLYSVDDYDVAGVILSNDRTRLLGAYHFDHFRVDHYFDAAAAQKDELIKNSFPGYKTTIVSRSLDENRMIVSAIKDNAPGKYIWLDLATKAANVWFSAYPYLDGKALPNVTPFEFEARDGMMINGYLTLPLEHSSDKPSLVVLPHGGPKSRDYQYFDHWVQFLANRGHAVLQVNFRGSQGFGSDFETAGYRQWGRAMQQDVYDAVAWLAEQGTVDTNRKCIVGSSYGGYVALTAAYQEPDAYQCVVSIAGIADLYEMAKLESLSRSRKRFIAEEVGNPYDDDDRKMLRENSAIRHLDRIEAPLLVIHGTEDTRVRIEQTRDFYNQAERAGIKIDYIELEDGTHFLDEYNNRLAVFEALDGFLKKHL